MVKYFLLAFACAFVATDAFCQNNKEDEKYLIDTGILIKTKDGSFISALMVRPKADTPQTVILQFTVYARGTDINKAKDAAARGYIGVIAYTRGKRYSPSEPVPYEYDGRDVYEVIDWISKQPWCNGQVGMFGGSYNGFTQWAATKRLHPALKTIVPAVSVAPGLDVPMTNNVVMNFVFPWSYYISNNKWLDDKDYNETDWAGIYFKWYNSGAAHTSLDSILGRAPNKIFRRWLQHPSYDSYWQSMIPYGREFANINIPVFSITGYFDGGQIGATYYLREHHKYNKKAEHYLLIGPYGHFGAQRKPDSVYNGYAIDSVARIPIHDIIYQWFNYIFKGAPRPAILKNKINFQVMGANEWKHVSSLNTMATDTLKFYLTTQRVDTVYSLSPNVPKKQDYILQTVDFADRNSMNSYYWGRAVMWDSLSGNNDVIYISDPLKEDMIISGSFLGEIRASINKKDFDFSVNIFEILPDGRNFHLSYFMGRASYVYDKTKRRLLTPGKIETIPFTNTYITSKKLSKGNRIILLVNVPKSPFEQINYGTGKDVSRETIKDAKEPLRVKWYNSSFIKIPVIPRPE